MRTGRWVLVGVVAGAGVAGCQPSAPERVEGGIGVGVNGDGQPVVHFVSCGPPVEQIIVAQGREGLAPEEENVIVGEWTVGSMPSGALDLAVTPADGDFLGFAEGTTYIVSPALGGEEFTVIGDVTFTMDQLVAVGPGEVLLDDGSVTSVDNLADCGTG